MGNLNDALEVLCLAQCHAVPCGIMWHDMFRDVLVWLLWRLNTKWSKKCKKYFYHMDCCHTKEKLGGMMVA